MDTNRSNMSRANSTPLMDALQEELKGLFPIGEEAAAAYQDKLAVLTERVDEEILQSSNVAEMIGHCPVGN